MAAYNGVGLEKDFMVFEFSILFFSLFWFLMAIAQLAVLSVLVVAAAAAPRVKVPFDYGWRFHFGPSPDGDAPGPLAQHTTQSGMRFLTASRLVIAPGPGDVSFANISNSDCTNMVRIPKAQRRKKKETKKKGKKERKEEGPACALTCFSLFCFSPCLWVKEYNPNRFSPGDCMLGCAYNPQCLVWQHTGDRQCFHGSAASVCKKDPKSSYPFGGLRAVAPPVRTTYDFASETVEDDSWQRIDLPHDFVVLHPQSPNIRPIDC
jgi:hypothetical protein